MDWEEATIPYSKDGSSTRMESYLITTNTADMMPLEDCSDWMDSVMTWSTRAGFTGFPWELLWEKIQFEAVSWQLQIQIWDSSLTLYSNWGCSEPSLYRDSSTIYIATRCRVIEPNSIWKESLPISLPILILLDSNVDGTVIFGARNSSMIIIASTLSNVIWLFINQMYLSSSLWWSWHFKIDSILRWKMKTQSNDYAQCDGHQLNHHKGGYFTSNVHGSDEMARERVFGANQERVSLISLQKELDPTLSIRDDHDKQIVQYQVTSFVFSSVSLSF